MDIRAMDCFVTVAEELHFHRAAERLHLTQPSLSQRIRALEHEIGTALFVRDRRSVALTPAGQAFLEPARRVIDNARIAREQALRATRGETGRLRLGFTVLAFYGLLPEAVQAFRRRYPDVEVDLVEMNSPSLETALTTGTIDLAILHPPLGHADLMIHSLPDEELTLALPESHRLAALDQIPIKALAEEPMLIAPRSVGPSIYDRMIALFQSEGVTPRIVQEVTPMTTLSGLVAAGTGIGFVTRGLSRQPRPGVCYRPVTPTPPSLPMAASWLKPDLSATGRRFLDEVLALYAR
ncbi:DNA-binding transcriptional regulator, LysR family [Rhizobium sp. NFR07]|uniref:LysR family transcriptional regulator n=1 Tax=Rhizobium sp. NFR07 TaxID=1566262 RepID=UPI0008F19459|nr:LysR family transcriptional regulator [Rhizobium sp. NFR07]SFB39347.1 DNA-binding transcriptional regulator, LysR family [Rhizobium sp. NFR07]